MKVEYLDLAKIDEIYNGALQNDFPPQEIKPFDVIKALYENGEYFACGLFDEEELVGYAMFCEDEKSGYVLLDYLAIKEERRNQGMGKFFLYMLKKLLDEKTAMLIESEAVTPEDSDEVVRTRMRRQRFYKRNGCLEMDASVTLFSTKLDVLLLPCGGFCDRKQAFRALQRIYARMLPDSKDVTLTLN